MVGMTESTPPPRLTGIVLAAGAGTRMGRPKALIRAADGDWLERATSTLLAAGCERVVVVLGAQAEAAQELVPTHAAVLAVVADRWADGMSASLRTGLEAATGDAAVVTLVDLPGLPADAVRRVCAAPVTAASLRRAVYEGRPGHPVLLGRAHWGAVAAGLAGDRGAREYLVTHDVVEVECGDLFDGRDVDERPPAGRPARSPGDVTSPI